MENRGSGRTVRVLREKSVTPEIRRGLWGVLGQWVEEHVVGKRGHFALAQIKAGIIEEVKLPPDTPLFEADDDREIVAYLDRHPELVRSGLGQDLTVWKWGSNTPPNSQERPFE